MKHTGLLLVGFIILIGLLAGTLWNFPGATSLLSSPDSKDAAVGSCDCTNPATKTVVVTETVTTSGPTVTAAAIITTVTSAVTLTATITTAGPTVTATTATTTVTAAEATVTVLAAAEATSCAEVTCGDSSTEETLKRFAELRDRDGGWLKERPTFSEQTKQRVLLAKFGEAGRTMMDNLLLRIVEKKGYAVILELGSYFGHSVKRWASVSDKVRAIALDPFDDKSKNLAEYLEIKGLAFNDTVEDGEAYKALQGNGSFYAVQDFLWEWKDNIAFLRGRSPAVFAAVDDTALPCVDVVYIDGGKSTDLADHVSFLVSQSLYFTKRFPNTLLSGDDFTWKTSATSISVRAIEKIFQWEVKVMENRTWVAGPGDILQQLLPEYPRYEWPLA